MDKADKIKAALEFLQLGSKLNVNAAITILQSIKPEDDVCTSCISPMACEFNDRCQKGDRLSQNLRTRPATRDEKIVNPGVYIVKE